MVQRATKPEPVTHVLPHVRPVREASREMVRELGFLQTTFYEVGVSHSQCHALLEIERRGAVALGELAEALRLDKSTTSRVVSELKQRAWVTVPTATVDRRRKQVSLTAKGRDKTAAIHREANARVEGALRLLREPERDAVVRGLELYAGVLRRARMRDAHVIRSIERADAPEMARIIREVMPSFGASGPGFVIVDPEVDDMFSAYRAPRCAYFVIERAGRVVGGGGVAPLVGGDKHTCELRKMYFLPDVRGLGLGQAMLERCLVEAKALRFRRMYLETLTNMKAAKALYEKNGFVRRASPLGSTGHYGCNEWYEKSLEGRPDAQDKAVAPA